MPVKPRRDSRRAVAAHHGRRRDHAPAGAPWKRSAQACLFLFALVLIVYANSISNEFVFDDHLLLDFNPEVNLASAQAIEQRAIAYRPIRTLSYVLDRTISGHRPAAYRVGNLVYHALAGCVALVTYQQLGLSPTTALLGAALFLAHPVQTESVAYISGRRDVLCGLFVLLAFSLYLRGRTSHGRPWHLALAGVAVVLGALTKEVALAFPLLVVAYDVTVAFGPARPAGSVIAAMHALWERQRGMYLMLAVLAFAAVGYFAVTGIPTDQPWWGGTIVTNFLNVALLWVHSTVVLLCPVWLLADYSYEAVPLITTAAAPLAWAAVAALLGLLIVSYHLLRRAPLAVFLLWWSALTLLPSSHVLPHHDFFAEHYLYLPVFGFAGWLALLLARVGRRLGWSRRRLEWAGLLLVLLYGTRTAVRNRDWHDDLTLWRATSAAAPRCARARANYGGALLAQYDIDAAEREFRASEAIKPQTTATTGLIMIAHAKGRIDERDRLLRGMENERTVTYTNLLSMAGWFLMNREYPLAIEVAQHAAARPAADERAWTIEGWAQARSGQFGRACPLFERALQRNPDSRDARDGVHLCRQQNTAGIASPGR